MRSSAPTPYGSAALVLAASAALFSCNDVAHRASESSPIVMQAPGRLRQALMASHDTTLCGEIDVRLTFGRTDDLGAPAINNELLVPKAGCAWTTTSTRSLPKGTYDLVARFTTRDNPGTCTAPLLVGAYVKRMIQFPPTADFMGLQDTDFKSRPGEEGALNDSTVSFNVDMDRSDNLAEVAVGSDPCKPNSVPVVMLDGVMPVTEGQPISLAIQSVDMDDIRHRVVLKIKHMQDLSSRPDYKTTEIQFIGLTNDPDHPLITPVAADKPPMEAWQLTNTSPQGGDPMFRGKKGAGRWTLSFVPRDPFVGDLSFEYSADDGEGNILFGPMQTTANVTNVKEPATIVVDGIGTVSSTRALSFAEQAMPSATSYLFRFFEADVSARPDQWTPRITAITPTTAAAVMVKPNGGKWELDWLPANDDAVRQPQSGYRVSIEFDDQMHVAQGNADLFLRVDPLWNDPPIFDVPTAGELALPKSSFPTHTTHFVVHDPDQVDTAPTCTVTIMPHAPTTCMSPFQSVRCEPAGARSGPDWPFQLIVVPAADYFAACGSTPSFSVQVSITDVAPARAPNGNLTFSTVPDCSGMSDPCLKDLVLRTANVVAPGTVSGGPGMLPTILGHSAVIVDGVKQAGLVSIVDALDSTGTRLVVVDLRQNSPSYTYAIPKSTLCSITSDTPQEMGVADEVNHRILVYSFLQTAGSCGTSDANVLGLVSLSSLTSPTIRTYPQTQYCAQDVTSHPGNPVVDSTNGNIYVPCGGAPGYLARIASDGTMTGTMMTDRSDSCNCSNNIQNDFIVDGAGVHWLIWPEATGIFLVNLATIGMATPVTMHLTPNGSWNSDNITDHVVDNSRKTYVMTYNLTTTSAELWRIDFSGSTPAVRGPLMLTNTSGKHILLRRPGREPAAEADLVVDGDSGDTRPYVDLDGWRIVATADSTMFVLGQDTELFPTPDHRYFSGPTSQNDAGAHGLYLFTWDPMAPRTFLDLGIPSESTTAITVSRTGFMMVFPASTQLNVLYFVDAAMGLDQ